MIHPLSDNASCLTNYQWPPLVISQSGILTLCEWTCSSPPRTSGVVSPWYWTQSWTRCLQCVAECSPLACYVPVYQTEHLIIYNIRFISIIILSMFLTPYFSKLLNRICYVLRIMKERKKKVCRHKFSFEFDNIVVTLDHIHNTELWKFNILLYISYISTANGMNKLRSINEIHINLVEIIMQLWGIIMQFTFKAKNKEHRL